MVKLIRADDKYVSDSDLDTYMLVVDVADRFGVEPSMSRESEDFFVHLVEAYAGDPMGLRNWLEAQIPRVFVALGERPHWIQGAQWPFARGEPMIFAGQIGLSPHQSSAAEQLLHDDTVLYVFLAPKAEPVVVVQQM